jgi:hypothetical protein
VHTGLINIQHPIGSDSRSWISGNVTDDTSCVGLQTIALRNATRPIPLGVGNAQVPASARSARLVDLDALHLPICTASRQRPSPPARRMRKATYRRSRTRRRGSARTSRSPGRPSGPRTTAPARACPTQPRRRRPISRCTRPSAPASRARRGARRTRAWCRR